MDREATTNDKPTSVDIDAIDTDMKARAGDAELIPWLRGTEAEYCHVGGLLPYMTRTACSLSSRLMAAVSGERKRWCRWCR